MKAGVKDFGSIGVATDYPEFDLPPNAFTHTQNVRVADGVIGNINCGYTDFATTVGVPLDVEAFHDSSQNVYWVYSTATDIRIADPSTEVLGTGYSNATYWITTVLTGVPVFTWLGDAPQYWKAVSPVQTLLPLPWDTTDVTDWDNAYGSTYRAESIRSHKNFLFAMNITEAGVSYNKLVHWSHPAEPGLPPPTWKYREPDNLSGRIDIAETDGQVLDGLTLGDSFVVYKTDSVWKFTFIGGNAVFRKTRIQSLPGMLSRKCMVNVDIEGGSHVVLHNDDIYIHNGQTYKSLVTDRVRERVLSLISPANYQNCFVTRDSYYKEVWVCVPAIDSVGGEAGLAAVWSWEDDTWTFRDLPNLFCASEGEVVSPGRTLINNAVGTIGSDHTLINAVSNTPKNVVLVGGSDNQKLLQFDTGLTNNGVPFLSQVQREFLQVNDEIQFNTVDTLFITAEFTGGNSEIQVKMGSHKTMRSPVRWGKSRTFDIKTDRKVNPRVTGAYHAIDIRDDTGTGWGLSGIKFEHFPAGER